MEDGKLSKYVIAGILGKGAMGTVYDARDPVIDRRVAIKTLALPDASDTEAQEELARFKREAQAAGRLAHPNIVGVFDYGETAKIAYIVMEFVDGSSLKSMLEQSERFPTAETVRIMEELLAGLQYSHDRGVVHRDIKPANIMLTRGGQVKIADFGIARIESSSMTQAGTIMGTPAYMSPEQIMGQTVDARTDIYSTGVVLYQMLTGERPFEGSMTAIMHKVLNTTPPSPSQLSVTAPEGLDPVVVRAMSKRPEERFSSAQEFAKALRAALEARPAVPPSTPPEPADGDATMVAPVRGGASAPLARTAPVIGAAVSRSAAIPPSTDTPATKSRAPLMAGAALVLLAAIGGGAYFMMKRPPGPMSAAVVPGPSTPQLPPVVPPPVASPTVVPPPVAVPPVVTPPIASPPIASPPIVTPPIVAPPVVVPPVVIPPVVATPPASGPSVLRNAIAVAIAGVPCALVDGDVSDRGSVTLNGLSSRDADTTLRRLIGMAAGHAPLAWRVASFDGPFCALLDTVRPVTRRFGMTTPDVHLALKSGPFKLPEDSNIVPRLTMPDYPGYVQLSYMAGDGSFLHLYPSVQARQIDVTTPDGRLQNLKVAEMDFRQFPAGATVVFADPETWRKPEQVGWQVAPPFGVDALLVTVSAEPLFAQGRPSDETPETFRRELKAALDSALRRGVRVNARVLPIETSPK